VTRANFHGVSRRSPINDEKEIYFQSGKKFLRNMITISINAFMILLLIGIIVGMIQLRIFLAFIWTNEGQTLKFMSTTIPSVVNTIVIMIFNFVYTELAYRLTNFENHKTYSAYERALIIKTFIFQFLNQFNMLFYIAFVKKQFVGCLDTNRLGVYTLSKENSCANELANLERSILITMLIKNFINFGIPFAMKLLSDFK
jgi:hypothetical protein